MPLTFDYTATTWPSNGQIDYLHVNSWEDTLEAASVLSHHALTKPESLDPSGATSSSAGLQAAVDEALAYTGGVVLDIPRGRYKIGGNGVFIDPTTAEGPIVIDFHGSTLELASDLPTVAGFETAGARWGFQINTDRTLGLSGGVVTVNDSTRSTGSGGHLRAVVIKNAHVTGGNADRCLAYFNRGPVTLDHVSFEDGLHALSGYDYTDGVLLIEPYSRGSGNANQVYYRQTGQGDGLVIIGGKSDSSVRMAKLTTCHGAEIIGNVTAGYDLIRCSGINFRGAHQEPQQATTTALRMFASWAKLDGCVVYLNWSATQAPIEVDDTLGASELVLDDVVVVSLHTTATAASSFSPLIDVKVEDPNTRITARGVTGRMASSAIAGTRYSASQPLLTGSAYIVDAVEAPEGMQALASGTWELHRRGANVWTLVPGGFYVSRQEAQPAFIDDDTSASTNTGGSYTPSSTVQYAFATLDAEGRYSQVSAARSVTVGTDGAVLLTLGLSKAPTVVILWRDIGTSVLTAPDAYCILPVRDARPRIYDTGYKVNGHDWVSGDVASRIPNTVAATNHTVSELVLV